MAAGRTNRLCFVLERDGRVDIGVYERLSACHPQLGSPADSSPRTVDDVPMPSAGRSTANFFLLDRHRMLHLIYSWLTLIRSGVANYSLKCVSFSTFNVLLFTRT